MANYGREVRMEGDIWKKEKCYDLKLKELSNKTTLILSNTRELDRVPNTK